MRIIVAYLAACVVAATIVFVYLQFKLDLLPESMPSTGLLAAWIANTLGLILGGTAIIGGILAVPWLSMFLSLTSGRQNETVFSSVPSAGFCRYCYTRSQTQNGDQRISPR